METTTLFRTSRSFINFTAMEKRDFLKPSFKQIRKSIRGIAESYSHEWDILGELCQNSVDAIRKRKGVKGKIDIHINSQEKTIAVHDNGCGISPDKLEYLLAPFSTDKDEDPLSIGEKGVGLTFAIFSCNDFSIKTGNKDGSSMGKVSEASNWKNSNENRELMLFIEPLDYDYEGTYIELKRVDDTPIFNLTFPQLSYLLRTKTSIGNTFAIWKKDIEIDVTLTHTNIDGLLNASKIDFSYQLPTEGYGKNEKISIDDYNDFLKIDRSDLEKTNKLKDKIIYKEGPYDYKGSRLINYWACYVPHRKSWQQISTKNKLATETQYKNPEFLMENGYVVFNSGITVSVKGMPTGITLDHPITGEQGSWPQLFIIIEDHLAKFDIGRKFLHGRQAKIYKELSKQVFYEFRKLGRYLGDDSANFNTVSFDRDEVFSKIEKLLPLNSDKVMHQKIPSFQEATVVGLFYEMMGKGILTDIKPLSSGYKRKYDLYAKWGEKKVVIEFKAQLKDILKDFDTTTKFFDEINCVVCWNVDEQDVQLLSDAGITVSLLERSEFSNDPLPEFPNATHIMSYSHVKPTYVIDLKRVLF